jgi:hypothetical protein
MINQVLAFIKPNSTRGAILSSCISMGVSKLAAKGIVAKKSAAWLMISGLLTLPYNEAAMQLAKLMISIQSPAETTQKVAKRTAPARRIPLQLVTAKVEDIKKVNPLTLHTFEKEYTCTFKGKVTCGEGLCNAGAVQIHLTSKGNPNIVRNVMIQPDGSYEVSVLLKEFLNEHIDWWIVADSPDSASKQLQGREILMDDTQIKIEEPIRLL